MTHALFQRGRAFAVLVASLAAGPPALAQSGEPLHLECAGPFARDASEATLADVFGRDQVVAQAIDGPEGSTLDATLVFPDDPARRLVVLWHDEAGRKRPAAVIVQDESGWIGPGGVRLGASLAEVEAANGEPFIILGFGWDYGGTASFPAGALANLPGGCTLSVTFEPKSSPLGSEFDAIMGDQPFASNNPLMQAAELSVREIAVGYPQ